MFINEKTKTKHVIALFVLIFIGNLSMIFMSNLVEYQSIDTLNSYNNDLRDGYPKSQGIVQDDYTIEWLDNPTFEPPITPWYNTTEGDASDVNATTDFNQANYKILGDSGVLQVDNALSSSDWSVFQNPRSPILPDTYGISSAGAEIYHYWDEDINQTRNTPSIHWKRNIEMPVNMSDYIITSASLEVIYNATVEVSPHAVTGSGIDRDGDNGLTAYAIGDFAEFYILISDVNNIQEYQLAYYKTIDLGRDSPATPSIADTILDSVPEEVLISLLTAVLSEDNYNFTITMGIDIYCEDNEWGADEDEWTSLLFKSLNLTFTYQKRIDKFTSLSWNQIGNTISGSNIDIKNATLNFKYKIDNNWTEESPNSELRFFINNNQYPETVKLSTATSTFQDGKVGGFDVTNLILKNDNITLSIQLYLADTFALGQEYTLSIDNASLLISYTETTIEETTSLDIFLNDEDKTLEKSVEVTMGNDVNVTVMYKDSLDAFIPDATVRLVGAGGPRDLIEDLASNQYSIVFSSTELSLGNNFLTIEASKTYYEPISELINIKVIERNTELLLFLDEFDKTLDKAIQMIYGNTGNITIIYKDIEQLPGTHIDGATVELIGIGAPQSLTEDLSNNQYFIIIDTKDLGLGNSFLTVDAYKENYTAQSIRFKIEVLESNSYLDNIKLNGIETPSIEIPWNEILSISLSYNESITNIFISEALVQLSGTGISESFTENSPIDYSLNINTALMALGINFLTISANKENYTLSSRIITVSVTERATKVDVYLNGTLSSNFEFYNISIGEKLNITVFYKDLNTDAFIDSANVRLIESGTPTDLTESLIFEQYYITITSDALGVGVKFLTITAKTDNYTLASEVLTLIINEKKTELLLFLNGTQYNNGDTIQLEVTDTLNITVNYLDNLTKEYLSGADVDIIDKGYMTENALLEHYNITINIIDLNNTLNRIVIRAQVTNYQTALIEFFIQIIERGSTGALFINELNKTADPYIDLTLGSLLNITIKFSDIQTENHISGAIVQLNGDLTGLLLESVALEQYSIIISTTDLGVGLSIFTIIAEKENFELFLIQKIYVNVDRIRTNITTTDGVSNIIIRPGESVTLSIVINDLDFGGTVKGASVTYRWIFGQGFLTENDGIYTVVLRDTPEGSFTLTLNAFMGENYGLATYEIVITVIIPKEDLLLFQLLSIIGGITAAALVAYLYLYQKIFKFPKPVRKVRKYGKTLRKTKNPSVDVTAREKAFKVKYQNELSKNQKLLKRKPGDVPPKPDNVLKKPIES
ncbi:MAG: hypothetical protein E3J90_08015 [Promethearchaeota archaeon]|nr:MAG: hypothetical protein E3J90_08015 [Candidatus Lokiarchaeota archaeon]